MNDLRPISNSKGRERPIFSIIIPCWNAEATLAETLESVLAQDLPHWEAIIVDDGSTDSSPEIAESYMKQSSRFTFVRTSRGGPSYARNRAALDFATGTYFAFLDSDDLWSPDKLRKSLSLLHSQVDIAVVYGRIAFFRESPQRPETFSTVYDRPLTALDLLRDNPVCTTSNLVVRGDVFRSLGGFDADIVHNEDMEFLLRVVVNGFGIIGCPDTLVHYRTSFTGLSANLQRMRGGWEEAARRLQTSSKRLSEAELAAADAGNLRYLSRRALRTGGPAFQALGLAAQGLSRSPLSFFNPPWRGGMTLLGALACPLLPASIRKLVFSR